MSDDLKSCPFCDECVEMHDYTDKPAAGWVMVHRCKIIGPISLTRHSGAALASLWNTRSEADALRARVAELEAALQSARNEALEEAANVADAETGWCGTPHQSYMDFGPNVGPRIAAAIRALKEQSSQNA